MSESIIQRARLHTSSLLTVCEHYPYHNPAHTTGVFDRATYIAMNEWVNQSDLQDLQLACLFHDTGFTVQYEKNEHIGAKIARKWLSTEWYEESRIDKIENIIMATVLFSKPKTHLEAIIQDADLDNIGTKDEFVYSQRYLEEIRTIGHTEISDCTYWQFVYKLLTRYKFNTETAKHERHDQQERDRQHIEKYLQMLGCEVPHIDQNTMHEIQ